MNPEMLMLLVQMLENLNSRIVALEQEVYHA